MATIATAEANASNNISFRVAVTCPYMSLLSWEKCDGKMPSSVLYQRERSRKKMKAEGGR